MNSSHLAPFITMRKGFRMSQSGFLLCLLFFLPCSVFGEDPYRFFTWNVTYGVVSPLGYAQQGILINGQFPGPQIEAVTNDNLIVNVFNFLPEPFLISWNGVQQRRNSWQDGVYGTNCPIPSGSNFTYKMQVKDQIGSFFYFPSLAFHKAAGGYGGLKISSRPMIPVPFDPPKADYTLLIGDWYTINHYDLKKILDDGKDLPFPDGVLINGRQSTSTFMVEQGNTYRLRISNVGIATTLNVRIQGHKMLLVEVEGSHTIQNTYDSLDVHLGQSYSVLVKADQPPLEYYIVASTRFTNTVLVATAILSYSNATGGPVGPIPAGPTVELDVSLNQARTIRWNLTASAARPNPQGSYRYGQINVTRSVLLANSAPVIGKKQRYAVNGVSFVPADTPLKLADHFNISGVFKLGSMPDNPKPGPEHLDTAVMDSNFHDFFEIIFQNNENSVVTWHIDGHSFWVVGMDWGKWTSASRRGYDLGDAVSRCTVQVYPKAWSAIYVSLDNVGMWNIRSENWARSYLGQQFYLRVYTPSQSPRDELPIPSNALLCGGAVQF
ncbi:L-ascorbate oxidase homolog [Zingiber officinale]|nr:L-ascorbate oxidase homolog [Zingiber officinale]XP_042426479.1 L-ascorbate oxidase homolog [Zingiber officinale]